MHTTSYFKRLTPELREAILLHLAEHKGSKRPISITQVIHMLGERQLHVDLSEPALKNSIAEAAISEGLDVAFDGT